MARGITHTCASSPLAALPHRKLRVQSTTTRFRSCSRYLSFIWRGITYLHDRAAMRHHQHQRLIVTRTTRVPGGLQIAETREEQRRGTTAPPSPKLRRGGESYYEWTICIRGFVLKQGGGVTSTCFGAKRVCGGGAQPELPCTDTRARIWICQRCGT